MGQNRKIPKQLPFKLPEIRNRLDVGQEEMARRLKKVDDAVYSRSGFTL